MPHKILGITAQIRRSTKPGALKAHADIRIETDGGVLHEMGYAVVQKIGAAPFVGFPSRQGSTPGKYFPIVDADGEIKKEIFEAILTAYRKGD